MPQNDGPSQWSVQPELLTNISGSKGRNCGDRPGVGKALGIDATFWAGLEATYCLTLARNTEKAAADLPQ